jgi:hypothetical protein
MYFSKSHRIKVCRRIAPILLLLADIVIQWHLLMKKLVRSLQKYACELQQENAMNYSI